MMVVVIGVEGLGGHFDVFVGGVFGVRWVVAGFLAVVLVAGVGVRGVVGGGHCSGEGEVCQYLDFLVC